MKTAYLDCHSGISGDMTLASLIDAGASIQSVQQVVYSMGLTDVGVSIAPTTKKGFRGGLLRIEHPRESVHRNLADITALIRRGSMSSRARALALRLFERLARAEAHVHGTTIDRVHFHEVGGIDSIVDIVGVAVAWDELGIERAVASPVPTGTGTIRIAHGLVSLPAPATAELLQGIPVAPCGLPLEMTTPTGAVILAELVDEFGPMPSMQVNRIGYGAGQRDVPDRPNLLRILLGHALNLPPKPSPISSPKETSQEAGPEPESEGSDFVWVLETNLDDVSGEEIGFAVEQLWQLGPLDVFTTSISMKKNRPGTLLTVLCRQEDRRKMEFAMLEQTGSLGLRIRKQERIILPRAQTEVDTPWGLIPGKVSMLPSGEVQFSPEFDDCRQIALENGLRLRDVVAEIETCYRASQQLRRAEPFENDIEDDEQEAYPDDFLGGPSEDNFPEEEDFSEGEETSEEESIEENFLRVEFRVDSTPPEQVNTAFQQAAIEDREEWEQELRGRAQGFETLKPPGDEPISADDSGDQEMFVDEDVWYRWDSAPWKRPIDPS